MTPKEIAAQLASFTPQQLGGMDHASLYNARSYAGKDQQGILSPYEHRAFAREATQENPLMALPIAAGTLAYQPYKWVMGSRSAPALDQVTQGLTGVGEGLWAAFQNAMSRGSHTEGTDKSTSATVPLEALQSYLRGSSTASTPRR
jgi:hypothetical protein